MVPSSPAGVTTRFLVNVFWAEDEISAKLSAWALHVSQLPVRGLVISRPSMVLQTRDFSKIKLKRKRNLQANLEWVVSRKKKCVIASHDFSNCNLRLNLHYKRSFPSSYYIEIRFIYPLSDRLVCIITSVS